MKLGLTVLAIWISLMQTGCKTAASLRYDDKLKDINAVPLSEIIFTDPKEIVLNDSRKFKIDNRDLTLSYQDSTISLNSFYHTLTLNLNSPGRYKIEVQSLCSCIGFNKFLFIPQIELRNQEMELSHLETEMQNENLTLPVRMKRTWEIDTKKAGTLEFVLFTDNSRLDEKLERSASITPILLYGALGASLAKYPIKAGYQGRYIIKATRL